MGTDVNEGEFLGHIFTLTHHWQRTAAEDPNSDRAQIGAKGRRIPFVLEFLDNWTIREIFTRANARLQFLNNNYSHLASSADGGSA